MDSELNEAAAHYAFDDLFVDDLPRVASDAVARGLRSDSLYLLAGATQCDEPAELRVLFEAALRELGGRVPKRLEAAVFLKRRYAERVLAGALAARDGAQRIVHLYHAISDECPNDKYVGDGFGIAQLVGNFYSFDDIPFGDLAAEREIEAALREDCRRILADGEGHLTSG